MVAELVVERAEVAEQVASGAAVPAAVADIEETVGKWVAEAPVVDMLVDHSSDTGVDCNWPDLNHTAVEGNTNDCTVAAAAAAAASRPLGLYNYLLHSSHLLEWDSLRGRHKLLELDDKPVPDSLPDLLEALEQDKALELGMSHSWDTATKLPPLCLMVISVLRGKRAWTLYKIEC